MRQYFYLLLVLAVLITAGCVEEYTPGTNVTKAQTQVTSSALPGTPAPAPTPGPAPAEMAYLSNIQCAVGDRSEAAYHCNGNVRIRSGVYDEVQVIARYPDNNTFKSGSVAMGGSEPVVKPFVIFPDLKYQGRNPDYFVKLDNTLYPVVWNGNSGVAWSNTLSPEEAVIILK